MTNPLDVYTQHGFCLVPIKHMEKVPTFSGAGTLSTYFKRKSTPDEHKMWWPNGPGGGRGNVGVICGEVSGNLIVLDLDNEDAAVAALNEMPWLNDTLSARTGKGYHFYLKSDRPPGHTFVLQYGGNDHHVKADNGYVVAPPSVHPNGHDYVLVDNPLLEIDLAVLVAGLTGAGFVPKRKAAAGERPENWHEELFARTFGDGERTGYAESLTGLLRFYIPGRPGLALGLLSAWNAAHCNPPLPDRKLELLIRSFYNRYTN